MNDNSFAPFHWFDQCIMQFDNVIKTLAPAKPRLMHRNVFTQCPAQSKLTEKERSHVAGLMRVNHAGEVCAQALYQGQAFTAKLEHVKTQLEQAAQEEHDHLAWCEQRLDELKSHTSYLNIVWYVGSFFLGAIAGAVGDSWSLGFVAETERQVSQHLQNHLNKLPKHDLRTSTILEQMKQDETEHAMMAEKAGAALLPAPIKHMMRIVSKIMTKSSYYI